MNDLLPSFRDSILSPLSDPASELLETGIDMILESNALKEIPIVSTVSAVCKIGINLHERNLLKQTFEFLRGFNDGSIDAATLEAHRLELEADPEKQVKELSRVMIILRKQVDDLQSRVLGFFYRAFIKGAVSWNKFCELAEDLCGLHQCDAEVCESLGGRALLTGRRCPALAGADAGSSGICREHGDLPVMAYTQPAAARTAADYF